jgi:hypothetical protein
MVLLCRAHSIRFSVAYGIRVGPQKERMDAGIYFPLFIVVVNQDRSAHAV